MSQKRPWLDVHQLARDPGFRPGSSKTTSPDSALEAGPGQQGPAESGLGVMCKGCGSDQVIPIPIWVWGLTAESDHDLGVLVVPVALVCLECGAQSIYQAKWRPGEEAADGG